MKQIVKILNSIGLSKTESEIYLAGLNIQDAGVKEIAKATQIKRPTIYHALSTLGEKGLVAKKDIGLRTIYKMTSPDNIRKLIKSKIGKLEKQETELEELIPLLNEKLGSELNDRIVVSHFDGLEGIKVIVEEALYCKSGHWDIIAPEYNFFSDFDKTYGKYFIEMRKRKAITARSLWESNVNRRVLSKEEAAIRKPRFLPKVMYGKFKSVIIIFDDKVAIISSAKELTGVLIKSVEIHDTHLAMFEGLWSLAKDYFDGIGEK